MTMSSSSPEETASTTMAVHEHTDNVAMNDNNTVEPPPKKEPEIVPPNNETKQDEAAETPAMTLSLNEEKDEAAIVEEALSFSEEKSKTKQESCGGESPEKKQEERPKDDAAAAPEKNKQSRKRAPYKYDPNKVTLRFIFANKDGISVTIDCEPADTVGEVKGALLSVWPKELPGCAGGDRLRLICMGKGLLMPDSKTLEECNVPTFKTHATPVNVSVRPDIVNVETSTKSSDSPRRGGNRSSTGPVEQGCSCVIL